MLLFIKAVVLSRLMVNIPVYYFRKNQLVSSGRLIAGGNFIMVLKWLSIVKQSFIVLGKCLWR